MIFGFGLLVPFFSYVALGFLAQRKLRKSSEAQGWLDAFVFYIAMPALLFQTINGTAFQLGGILSLAMATSSITVVVFLIGTGLSRLRKQGAPHAVFGLIGSYSNIGYMGPILAVQVFGSEAGLPAAIIFCTEIVTILALWSFASATGGESWRAVSLSIAKALAHPFILSVLVAIAFKASGATLPAPLSNTIIGFQGAAAPCALFSLGITLARQKNDGLGAGISIAVLFKLVGHPVLVALCLWPFFGDEPVWFGTAVMIAALPPAANIYVLARAANTGISAAATGVLYGTLGAMITVPVVIWALLRWIL
jgi:predicted permease